MYRAGAGDGGKGDCVDGTRVLLNVSALPVGCAADIAKLDVTYDNVFGRCGLRLSVSWSYTIGVCLLGWQIYIILSSW